jgi:MFS family permease
MSDADARLVSVTGSEVLPSRAFLRYWRADAVSGFGTYVTVFALQTLVVLTLHGSAADVGWLNAAQWLPYLVFGLVVGAIVDGRRRPAATTDRATTAAGCSAAVRPAESLWSP